MNEQTKRERELEYQLQEIRKELGEIQYQRDIEANRKALGKCYKIQNNYSCPETKEDYWFVYKKAVEVTKDGNLVWLTFQVDKYGKPSMERVFADAKNMGAYGEEIAFREYRTEFANFKRAVDLFLLDGELIPQKD